MRTTVRAVVVDKHQRAFLVQHYESNPNDMGKWATIGGGLDQGDRSHEACLLREISEEFGDEASRQVVIGGKLHVNHRPDRTDHFYAVTFNGESLEPKAKDEIMNYGWFTLDEVKAMKCFFGFEAGLIETALKINDSRLEVKLATADEIDQIIALIGELSDWLKTKGISQWSDSFPRAWLEAEIANEELFVHEENGRVVASLALKKRADEVWDFSNDNAIYLSRLAVCRGKNGRGLGQELVAWAEREVSHRGVPLMRLECDVRNSFLQEYYKRLGYEFQGNKFFAPYNMTFAKFQKRLK